MPIERTALCRPRLTLAEILANDANFLLHHYRPAQTKLDGAASDGPESIQVHLLTTSSPFANASTFASVAFAALCKMYLSWVCGADGTCPL